MKKIFTTLFRIFLPLIVGGIVAFIIRNSIDYMSLVRPILSPPKILFPIGWTIIYLLMGISYYIYKKEYEEVFFYRYFILLTTTR